MFRLTIFGWIVIGVYTAAIAFAIICFCTDTSQGVPQKIIQFFTEDVVEAISSSVRAIVGPYRHKQLSKALHKTIDYVAYRRNPLLQIFYLAIVCGAYTLVVLYGYPMIPCRLLSGWHKYTGFAAVAVCIYLWHLACTISPGIILKDTIDYYDVYPYHDAIYPAGRTCHTTGLRKLARSKFCRYMQANIARFDHFCPWLNQAVGQDNYRNFLLFLFAHVLLLTYGATVMVMILLSEMLDKDLLNAKFYSAKDGHVVQASKRVVIQYLISNNWMIFGVSVLCGVMAVVLFGFLCYHLYLVAMNTTTNESYKWQELSRFYKNRVKFELETERLKEWRKSHPPLGESQNIDLKEHEEIDRMIAERTAMLEELPKELPKNPYNRGILANFWEVAFPIRPQHNQSNRSEPIMLEAVNVKKATGRSRIKKRRNGKGK